MAAAQDEEYIEQAREPCPVCGRFFVLESLNRHTSICKNAQKKRKVFDSAKQRVLGDDLTYEHIKKAQKSPDKKSGKNWRISHEQLLFSLQNARATQIAISTGGPLPPPPPPTENPDYIKCETCGRSFNESAAMRHIPFCAEKSKCSLMKVISGKKTNATTQTQYKMSKSSMTTKCAGQTVHSSTGSISRRATNNPLKTLSPGDPLCLTETSSEKTYEQYGANNSASSKGKRNRVLFKDKFNSSYSNKKHPIKSPSYYDDILQPDDKIVTNGRNSSSGYKLRTGKDVETYVKARRDICKPIVHLQHNEGPKSLRPPPGGFAESPLYMESHDRNGYHHSATKPVVSDKATKFCHQCGTKYPLQTARFCCECGQKRILLI